MNEIWRPIYGKLMVGIRQVTPEWRQLKQLKKFQELSPRYIKWPIILRNGGGIAFTEDGGSLARPGTNRMPEGTGTWTYITGRIQTSFDAIVKGGGMGKQQISSQLGEMAADKLRAFQRHVAIWYYGKPDNILFKAQATSARVSSSNQATITLKDLYGSGGTIPQTLEVADYISEGGLDYITVHNGTGSGTRANFERKRVSAIRERGNTANPPRITVDGVTANWTQVQAGDAIVFANQYLDDAPDDYNRGLNGLLHLCRDETVHGINQGTWSGWRPSVDVSSGVGLDHQRLYIWRKRIKNRSGMDVSWMHTTYGVIAAAGGGEVVAVSGRAKVDSQPSLRRYDAGADAMRLSFESLKVGKLEVMGRTYCPPGHLFMGSKNAVQKLAPDQDLRNVVQSGEFADSWQQVPHQLAGYHDQVMRTQMVAKCRAALGVVSGLTEIDEPL